jgi:hypothetical protein
MHVNKNILRHIQQYRNIGTYRGENFEYHLLEHYSVMEDPQHMEQHIGTGKFVDINKFITN